MITEQPFKKTIAKLFGSGHATQFPKRYQDQLIFLGAAALHFTPQVSYTEKEINTHLIAWLTEMEATNALDHVTLRRYLVDFKLLERDRAGRQYTVADSDLAELFEASILTLDIHEVIEEARAEREARRQKWEAAR